MIRFTSIMCAVVFLASTVSASDKTDLLVKLQVIMQRHVDSSLIDGAIHKRDLQTGEVMEYYPVDTHSMVMAIDEDYILCLDLAAADGSSVPVDFYITESKAGFRVYQMEIDNRKQLETLIRAGRVERVK